MAYSLPEINVFRPLVERSPFYRCARCARLNPPEGIVRLPSDCQCAASLVRMQNAVVALLSTCSTCQKSLADCQCKSVDKMKFVLEQVQANTLSYSEAREMLGLEPATEALLNQQYGESPIQKAMEAAKAALPTSTITTTQWPRDQFVMIGNANYDVRFDPSWFPDYSQRSQTQQSSKALLSPEENPLEKKPIRKVRFA